MLRFFRHFIQQLLFGHFFQHIPQDPVDSPVSEEGDFFSATEFSVPGNVRAITLTTCSAGDGGNGDSGKKGTDSIYWISDREIIDKFDGGFYYGAYRRIRSVVVSASDGNQGQNGAQGEIVTLRDKQTGKLIFSSSNESFYENPIPDLDVCRGGYGGENAKKGANKKIFETTISVEPNQIFIINIPIGGSGGEGGLGGRYSRVTKVNDGEGVCEKEYAPMMTDVTDGMAATVRMEEMDQTDI